MSESRKVRIGFVSVGGIAMARVAEDAGDEAHAYIEALGGSWGEELILEASDLPRLSPFHNYIQHWVDCLIHDREPVTDEREGLASLELITASYQSSSRRAFVELSHQMILIIHCGRVI